MENKEWVARHPIAMVANFKRLSVPLRLFGDGVACMGIAKAWGRSIEAITISSYLNSDNSKLAQAPITLIWKGKRVEGRTMARAWQVISWSLQACFEGKHPLKDHNGNDWPRGSEEETSAGKDLAGGYRGVLVARLSAFPPRGLRLWKKWQHKGRVNWNLD